MRAARRIAALAVVVGALVVPDIASAGITLRSALGSNGSGGSSLVLNMPSGVQSGDVLVAQVAVRGGNATTISVPSGWSFIRQEDGNTTVLRQALYYRVAGSTEPSSYTWNFNASQVSAGGIYAFSGVDTSNPVDTSSGLASTSNGTTITAPSVTTAAANEGILGFYSTAKNQAISTPTGMHEAWDVTPGTSIEVSGDDVLQSSAGASGNKVATVSGNAAWVGQLVALKPASACSGGSLTLGTPSSVSFPAVTIDGTNQTVSTTLALTPNDLSGTGAGWNITGTSTTFTNASSKTLSTTATQVTGASTATAAGNCVLPTNAITYPFTLPAGATAPTAVKLYNAAAGTGKGPQTVTLTEQLSVPANAYNGTYSSTWTIAIVSGP